MRNVADMVAEVPLLDLRSGDSSATFDAVTQDSRKVEEGTLFVALRGERFDGHDFIDDAVARGASALLVDASWKGEAQVPVVETASTRELLGPLGNWFFDRPSDQLAVVGLTGTNGKTTTSYLLESILNAEGRQVGVVGTIDYRWGSKKIAAANTTPDGLTLQRMLRQMVDDGVDTVVLEVSSHGLENGRVRGLGFDVAVFTNLSRDHLDFHDTMEAYRAAKWRLFHEFLRDRSSSEVGPLATAVINGDNEEGRRLARSLLPSRQLKVVTFDLGDAAPLEGATRIFAEHLELTLDGVAMEVVEPGADTLRIEAGLPGRFNAENILAAVAAARALEVGQGAVRLGLSDVAGVPGRMERVRCATGGPAVFVDYAHTPDALEQALRTLRPLVEGQLWVIFGCGGDRDKTKRRPMGEAAARHADVIVVTNDNPRGEEPSQIIDSIVTGIEDELEENRRVVEWFRCDDRSRAIGEAILRAHRRDVILVAGKGHETYQELQGQRHDFDDRVVAQQALQRRGGAPWDP